MWWVGRSTRSGVLGWARNERVVTKETGKEAKGCSSGEMLESFLEGTKTLGCEHTWHRVWQRNEEGRELERGDPPCHGYLQGMGGSPRRWERIDRTWHLHREPRSCMLGLQRVHHRRASVTLVQHTWAREEEESC